MSDINQGAQQYKARLLEIERSVFQLAGHTNTTEPSVNGFARLLIRVPQVRALGKAGFDCLAGLSRKEIIATWHYVFNNTSLYEVGSLAIYAYQHRQLTRYEFDTIKQWVTRCDCWEHSDDLSKVYAEVFEDEPKWVLPVYQRWNRASNPWQRRQSVVGLLEYAQKRTQVQPFDVLIGFVATLLTDDDYYVQKGVGWTLREIYNVYPDQTCDFLEDQLHSISPLAWSAATEKLDKTYKQRLNTRRKQHRSSIASTT